MSEDRLDNAADPNQRRQQREIDVARKRVAEFDEQRAGERKAQRRGG